MNPEPRAALMACADADDGDIGEAAIWLACDDHPLLDPAPAFARLDALAGQLSAMATPGVPPSAAVGDLGHLMADRLGLRAVGACDPRAHYIHEVMDRGQGVPIVIGAIWASVARRAGLTADGLLLPGHFLIRVNDVLIDVVAGGPADDEVVIRWLPGPSATLAAASTRQLLVRMSRNLRGCHVARGSWDKALRAADRCVELLPGVASERRDRGLLLMEMGRTCAAADDFRSFLDLAPADAPGRCEITDLLARLRGSLN